MQPALEFSVGIYVLFQRCSFIKPIWARARGTILLKASLFQLVCFHICAVPAPCSAAQNAVTTAPVTLEILYHGKQAGSTTIAAGREVQIVEEEEDRVKISVSPGASGWVNREAVEMHERVEPKVSAAHGEVDGLSAVSRAENAQPRPITESLGGVRPKTSRLIIEINEESENYPVKPAGGQECHGTVHRYTFRATVCRGEDLKGKEASLRFYLVVLQENKDKTASSSAVRRVVINGHSYAEKKKVYEPTVQAMKELSVSEGDEMLEPITHEQMEWQCNFCKFLRDAEYVGWYAELVAGDKVVCKTQSAMDARATNALQSYLADNGP